MSTGSTDKLDEYRDAKAPLPKAYHLWPLYGAGLENMGKDGNPIDVPVPAYGPDELLIRHDACGLCFSDIKVIAQGQNHPRVLRDMQKEPIVLGHEIAMTVIGVGKNLQDQYQVGDRLTLETDIFINGKALLFDDPGGKPWWHNRDRWAPPPRPWSLRRLCSRRWRR